MRLVSLYLPKKKKVFNSLLIKFKSNISYLDAIWKRILSICLWYRESPFYGQDLVLKNLSVYMLPHHLKSVIIPYLVECNFEWHNTMYTPWKLYHDHEIDEILIVCNIGLSSLNKISLSLYVGSNQSDSLQ
jgi:hypothetical protein